MNTNDQLSWLPADLVKDARVSLSLSELQGLLEKYAGLHLNFDGIDPTDGFGKRVRVLREKHQMTTAQLGKRVGVASSTLRHWEHGSGNPGFRYITALAEVFGIAPAQLFPQVPTAKLDSPLPEVLHEQEVTESIESSMGTEMKGSILVEEEEAEAAAVISSDIVVTEAIESAFNLDDDDDDDDGTDDFINTINGNR